MAVNVEYEGISLASGVDVRPTELGLFLPLQAPMPVGTRLSLAREGQGKVQPIRVHKVQEGADPGVYIAADGAVVFALIEEQGVPQVIEMEVSAPERAPRHVDVEVTLREHAPAPAPHVEAKPEPVVAMKPETRAEPVVEIKPEMKPEVKPDASTPAPATVDTDGDDEPEIRVGAPAVAIASASAEPEAEGDDESAAPSSGGDKAETSGSANGQGKGKRRGKRGGGKR